MMAGIQANGGYELQVRDLNGESIEKYKQLIQRLYIDKEQM